MFLWEWDPLPAFLFFLHEMEFHDTQCDCVDSLQKGT